jgi:site-specific DNA-methyltransferase (adenine-specific)
MKDTNTPTLPDKKYNIIYADPPWSYDDKLGSNPRWGAMTYPTMTQDAINALPIQNIAAKDCILFMWVTMPKLQEGLDTIKAWGFTYKTCAFCWVKQNPSGNGIYSGLGRWVNGNAEICLLATKGRPARVSKSVKQIVMAPRRRHSQKPDEVRDRIVELMGDLPRIELFARSGADGWDCWGNEAPNQQEDDSDDWMN